MNPPSKVTRTEVALAAKVSTYTVSQVMAGRSGPSQKT
jgi:DNA-binding LacI/PurR family transcriptional regulator